jgi:hypothetical protein
MLNIAEFICSYIVKVFYADWNMDQYEAECIIDDVMY